MGRPEGLHYERSIITVHESARKVFQNAGLKTALHVMGAPRISTNPRLGTRTDRDQTMEEKVQSVVEKM